MEADGRAHLRLDVLTYNIEGLQWPARDGRKAELAQIGQRLGELRQQGEAPDVIVFQEVFSSAARRAVRSAGYPAAVAGPSMWERRSLPSDGRVPGRRAWKRGEIGLRVANGGLAIVSRYPVETYRAEPFSHRACAGLDCLSNKGALFARIAIPGVPDPVDVFDSHMNSRHASRAAPQRTLISHHLESRELADFIDYVRDPQAPAILAGDFNIHRSEARFSVLELLQPLTLVHRYCLDAGHGCDVRLPWRDPTPWLDAEDLQFFRPGQRVDVRPVRMEPMFDGRAAGPALSDHAGLRVVYDLSWPVAAIPAIAHRDACDAGLPLRRS